MTTDNLRAQRSSTPCGSRPGLNAVTDKAATLIHAVERFLDEECKFGLSAHAVTSSESSGPYEVYELWLVYTRCVGYFMICVTLV